MKAMIKRILRPVCTAATLVCAPVFRKKSTLQPAAARQLLEDCHANPNSNPIVKNEIVPPVCDLQIIVPAYNVEQYLEECMASILAQETKYTYKIVLIDDGSTDSTGRIADKYSGNEHVIVIHQENAGFSGARNRGLKQIFGKYVMFVDSDDKLCPGAIEALMDAAVQHDCDIVEGSAFSLCGTEQAVFYAHPASRDMISASKGLHGMPWAKVFKAHCFEKIAFPERYWFEDSIFSFLIYPQIGKARVIDRFTYVYRINRAGSITAGYHGKPKAVDTYWITEKLLESRKALGLQNGPAFFEHILHQMVLNSKRVSGLPESVQESVFILQAELVKQYFSPEIIEAQKHLRLVQALLRNDWGMYKFCCRMTIFS